MISASVKRSMAEGLEKLERDAVRAEAAAPGLAAGAWEWITGGSAAPERNLAAAARRDADRFRSRFDALVSNPAATDAEGLRFVRDAADAYGGGAGAGAIVEAGAEAGSVGAALDQTIGGTLRDLGIPTNPADLAALVRKVAIGAAVVVGVVVVVNLSRVVRK